MFLENIPIPKLWNDMIEHSILFYKRGDTYLVDPSTITEYRAFFRQLDKDLNEAIDRLLLIKQKKDVTRYPAVTTSTDSSTDISFTDPTISITTPATSTQDITRPVDVSTIDNIPNLRLLYHSGSITYREYSERRRELEIEMVSDS